MKATVLLVALYGLTIMLSIPVSAHVFISRLHCRGAYPPYEGNGWIAELFLDIPNYDLRHHALLHDCLGGPDEPISDGCRGADLELDGDVDLRDMAKLQNEFSLMTLVRAERSVMGRDPDVTFRTKWIDFPMGPEDSDLDANFSTMRDFFNGYIGSVSDPEVLDRPFGSFLVRFTGFVKLTLADETRVQDAVELPFWVDFGTMGYDGFRTRVGETVYRIANVNWIDQPFFAFGPSIEAPGLYPIEVTYFNSYDPDGSLGNERAGVELYSWHGGGMAWPAGERMVHEIFGPATLTPPWIIYQEEDVRPLVLGDFDADTDVDMHDAWWFQHCFDPDVFFLPFGCDRLDFEVPDGRVDLDDLDDFNSVLRGPGIPAIDLSRP